jgi:hypothetical protein
MDVPLPRFAFMSVVIETRLSANVGGEPCGANRPYGLAGDVNNIGITTHPEPVSPAPLNGISGRNACPERSAAESNGWRGSSALANRIGRLEPRSLGFARDDEVLGKEGG